MDAQDIQDKRQKKLFSICLRLKRDRKVTPEKVSIHTWYVIPFILSIHVHKTEG